MPVLSKQKDPIYKSTYRVWANMKQRCLNEKHPCYRIYGGRGISVCERWLAFEPFLADMGIRPHGLSIERIDNNGNYEPSNCKWATQFEQVRNSSHCVMIPIDGVATPIREAAQKLGLSYGSLRKKLEEGFSIEAIRSGMAFLNRGKRSQRPQRMPHPPATQEERKALINELRGNNVAFQDIAALLGLSRQRIEQIHKHADYSWRIGRPPGGTLPNGMMSIVAHIPKKTRESVYKICKQRGMLTWKFMQTAVDLAISHYSAQDS